MSVTVTYAATATVAETIANNTGSAAAASRLVTHTNYNVSATLNSGSTPPATTVAEFLLTLSSGAATIDLTALTGTNGASTSGSGLKVQIVRIKNLGANDMTFYEGATNGHNMFSIDSGSGVGGQVVRPGGHIMLYANDSGDDISGTTKTWDVVGTGSQTAEVTIIMG